MLKQYKNNNKELQKIMLTSDENRAKVLDIKKSVRLADQYSLKKVTSLMGSARNAVFGVLLAAGAFTQDTTWRIVWGLLGAICAYIGFSEFRDNSRSQKSNEQDAIHLMKEVLNNTNEKRSL